MTPDESNGVRVIMVITETTWPDDLILIANRVREVIKKNRPPEPGKVRR